MPASSLPNEAIISADAALALMQLAHAAVERWLESGRLTIDPACPFPELEKMAGIFVTLRKGSKLRGCVGQVIPQEPMFRLVQELAVASASRDSRFPPLDRTEWPGIQMEISVLSPPRRMESMEALELGRHGIMIKKNERTGVFLPDVATEAGWSKEEFVRHCAEDKAGMDYRDIKNAEMYLFHVQKIPE